MAAFFFFSKNFVIKSHNKLRIIPMKFQWNQTLLKEGVSLKGLSLNLTLLNT